MLLIFKQISFYYIELTLKLKFCTFIFSFCPKMQLEQHISKLEGAILGVNSQKVYKKGYYHGLRYLTMIAA